MNEEIEILLNDILALIKSRNRKLMEKYDITPLQYRALKIIKERHPTMGDLCDALYISSSTVTELVDRLEDNNLVARVRSKEDRRVITLEITDEGNALLEKIQEERLEVLNKALNLLDEREKDEIREALIKLRNVLKEDKGEDERNFRN
ncbi:MAG: MarR family transcriptional regulator [bacterium]|nr:MarR family transcriptional regulator [bacterium]